MENSDKYKVTFETWNKVASLYQEKFMDLDIYNDSYDVFCGLITRRSAKILEIGCGPGNITKYLIAKIPSVNVTATDVAPNMIELAQQNNPAAKVIVMDCREIDKIPGKFDGIVCGFCLPYLSKEDCLKLFVDSFQLLESNGYFYLSTIEGNYENSGFEAASTGDRSFVYYYEEGFLRNEFEKHGFSVVHLSKKEYPKANGSTQVHLLFIAQKNN